MTSIRSRTTLLLLAAALVLTGAGPRAARTWSVYLRNGGAITSESKPIIAFGRVVITSTDGRILQLQASDVDVARTQEASRERSPLEGRTVTNRDIARGRSIVVGAGSGLPGPGRAPDQAVPEPGAPPAAGSADLAEAADTSSELTELRRERSRIEQQAIRLNQELQALQVAPPGESFEERQDREARVDVVQQSLDDLGAQRTGIDLQIRTLELTGSGSSTPPASSPTPSSVTVPRR